MGNDGSVCDITVAVVRFFFIPVLMILLPIMLLIIKLPGREERQILAVKNIYHYGKRKKLLALKNSTYALDDISSYVIS